MATSDRDKAFAPDPKAGPYLWCLHCERTYARDQWRTVEGMQMCPYDGCGGDAVLDAWEWYKVREGHADYPEVPEPGKVYPLY